MTNLEEVPVSSKNWATQVCEKKQGFLERAVRFLKKGAKRQRTTLALSDFKAERLKRVPGYVVLEAARKHVRLGIEAVLVLSLLGNLIFAWELIEAGHRLSQKRVALVPSRLDTTIEVDVGKISEKQVYSTLVMYLSLLGNVDGANIDENYRVLKDLMSPDFQIQFERDMRDYRQMVKEEGLAEQIFVGAKKVSIGESGQVRAEAEVRIRPSFGSSVGKIREEKITVEMRLITNYEKNQWLLQITDLKRAPKG